MREEVAEKRCYTIGHSKHTIERFVSLVKPRGISLIIDVRSIPYSRHAPQFNRPSIRQQLNHYNLEYEYFGDMLGGKAVNGERFQKGLEQVVEKIRGGCSLALMCAEKDPLNCHRFLLISPALGKYGIKTIHLLADGSEIENRELIEYASNKMNLGLTQPNLFAETEEENDELFFQALLMEKMRKK